MSAVDDVYTYLGPAPGQGLAGGVTGWSLLVRREGDPTTPGFSHQAVTVNEDGGRPPEIKTVSGIGDSALKDVGVLVTVRAAAWDGDVSAAKAAAILAALHGLRNVQLASGGVFYHRVRAMTPEPVFTGFDATGRPRHTVAFRLLTAAT